MQATCLSVRRGLLTEPAVTEREHGPHLRECPGCAGALREARRFEQALERAAEIEVPEGLAERILLRHEFALARRRRRRLWALAASVLLAVGIGAGTWLAGGPGGAGGGIDARVMAHVSDEFFAFDPQSPRASATIQVVLDRVGARLLRPLEGATFVALCPFGKGVAAHLVVRTERGPVTVLLVPGERISDPIRVAGVAGEGLVLPTAAGSLALVGPDWETVERLAVQVREAIAWGA